MSHQDKQTAAPSEPCEPQTEVPRSGAGAGTALFAMLKKRQMRASRDVEPDVESPGPRAGDTGNE
jgi:hypothetical protein